MLCFCRVHDSCFIVFCCGLGPGFFAHILQGYFTDTGAIVWLPQSQWSNPEEYKYTRWVQGTPTTEEIPYLTLKDLGQGHNKNRQKSSQVIYRSGPTIVPKIKEIKKAVQKLSHEQESAAGSCGGSGGGIRTGTKT